MKKSKLGYGFLPVVDYCVHSCRVWWKRCCKASFEQRRGWRSEQELFPLLKVQHLINVYNVLYKTSLYLAYIMLLLIMKYLAIYYCWKVIFLLNSLVVILITIHYI